MFRDLTNSKACVYSTLIWECEVGHSILSKTIDNKCDEFILFDFLGLSTLRLNSIRLKVKLDYELLWTITWHNNNIKDSVLEPLHG